MEDIAEVLEQELERAFEVKDKQSLHRYIKLLTQNIVTKSSYELQLLELRNDIRTLTETMKEGFRSVDKRFEAIDKRFEAINKRFEAVDKRFEAINKRFEAVDKRFEDLYRYMDKRFEAVDKRFEDMNKRFEDMNKRFSMMFTFMNIGFGIIILITILFKFIQ